MKTGDDMNDIQTSLGMTKKEAILLHNAAIIENDLLVWTVYQSPSDYPGKFVVRPSSTRRGGTPFLSHLIANSLDDVRSLMPPGLVCFQRAPDDDPVIVETWL